MTAVIPDQLERAQRRVDTARAYYDQITETLNAAIEAKLADNPKGLSDMLNALNTHWKALNTLSEKEAGLDELIRTHNGSVDGYAINMDTARSEIGRRLACLKTAAGD